MGTVKLTKEIKAKLLAAVVKGEFDTDRFPEFNRYYPGENGPALPTVINIIRDNGRHDKD